MHLLIIVFHSHHVVLLLFFQGRETSLDMAQDPHNTGATREELQKFLKNELKEICRDNQLRVGGTKEQLIQRLISANIEINHGNDQTDEQLEKVCVFGTLRFTITYIASIKFYQHLFCLLRILYCA